MKHFLLFCIFASLIAPATVSGQIGITSNGTTRKFESAGGRGSSFASAIPIYGSNETNGITSEYSYLSAHFPGAKPTNHSRQYYSKRTYDVISFTTADGKNRVLYFQYLVSHS